jgi:fatty-acyl-CoA synthase
MAIHQSHVQPSPWVDGLTIGQVLRETARRHPQQDAFVFCSPAARMTWAEFDAAVDRLARGLLGLGLVSGDHFGLWATNLPTWVLLQFATARIGVVLVNINPAYRANELKYALHQSDVRGLALIDAFKSSNFFTMLQEACPELTAAEPGQLRCEALPKLQWVVALRGQPPPGAIAWDRLLEVAGEVHPEQLDDVSAKLDPLDPINVQYTSGTTGQPKGAMLSHRNVLINAYYAGEGQRLGPTDRVCLPVPLYHCFGCVLGTMCCVVHGSAMVFPSESFRADATLAAIEQQRCTAIYGVPTMFIAQMEHEDYRRRDLSSLRTGIMAGSPCPIELMKRVAQEMGAREITIGYGQTESSPLITQTRHDDPLELRVGTVGQPIPGVEAKIVDPATGQQLDDCQQGELCTRGHNVMIGYYNMPEKTAEAIDVDGWLHTGDLSMRQPNGYFRITGRLRDVIIRGGENVYPREVEERLFEHPAVEVAQVVGIPNRRLGEEVLAWVKLRAGQTATEDELTEFCRASLAHFKVPRYWKFVDSFPTTVTGKIQKFIIRERAIEELGLQDIAKIETA